MGLNSVPVGGTISAGLTFWKKSKNPESLNTYVGMGSSGPGTGCVGRWSKHPGQAQEMFDSKVQIPWGGSFRSTRPVPSTSLSWVKAAVRDEWPRGLPPLLSPHPSLERVPESHNFSGLHGTLGLIILAVDGVSIKFILLPVV